jgi:hypothetical protein
VRSRTSHRLDRTTARPGPNGLGRAVRRYVPSERGLDCGDWGLGTGDWGLGRDAPRCRLRSAVRRLGSPPVLYRLVSPVPRLPTAAVSRPPSHTARRAKSSSPQRAAVASSRRPPASSRPQPAAPSVTSQNRPSRLISLSSRLGIRSGRSFIPFDLAAVPRMCDAPRRLGHIRSVTDAVAGLLDRMHGRDTGCCVGASERPCGPLRCASAVPESFFPAASFVRSRPGAEWCSRVENEHTIA